MHPPEYRSTAAARRRGALLTGPVSLAHETAWFEALATRVRAAPAEMADPAALARAGGVAAAELEARLYRHAHLTSAAWLARLRIEAVARALRETASPFTGIAEDAGFATPVCCARAFEHGMRMTPEAYRRLVRPRRGAHAGRPAFELNLPDAYRATEVLRFHARDPEGSSERVTDRTLVKALTTSDGAVVLEIELTSRTARCHAHAPRALGAAARAELHARALRLLGLSIDVAAFEAQVEHDQAFAPLLAKRRGLRLPLMADAFEGLCWAIVGQQINVAFATSLRRTLIELAGTRIDGMLAHPSPGRVAALDETALTTRRCSRAKARYLIGAARAIAGGALALESLGAGSAVAAELALTDLYGVGTWTARYTLMRGAGFADCAPVGDVALAAALQKWRRLDTRPNPAAVEDLLRQFSPFRSLATGHFWASLKDDT